MRGIQVYLHSDREHELFGTLVMLLSEVKRMSAQMDALTAAVARNTDVDTSAVTLIRGLKKALDELIASGADPAALQKLSDDLGASTQGLADALTENTPAEVVPPTG